jgi:hypothetical protein
MPQTRRINDTLGLRINRDKILMKTPAQALLEKVNTKLTNITQRQNARINFFPLSNLPQRRRLTLKGITNARKFPKLFGFLNTSEPNLPEL